MWLQFTDQAGQPVLVNMDHITVVREGAPGLLTLTQAAGQALTIRLTLAQVARAVGFDYWQLPIAADVS